MIVNDTMSAYVDGELPPHHTRQMTLKIFKNVQMMQEISDYRVLNSHLRVLFLAP